MSTISDGGPVFPIGSGDMRYPTRMKLRDYFAAQALTGIIQASYSEDYSDTAAEAYQYADAMLKARKAGPQ